MQVVGRKQPAVPVQLEHRGPVGPLRGPHAGMLGHMPALGEIAWCAGGDDIIPAGLAAARPGNEVIERQIVLVTAVLARELVAQEDIEARESRIKRRFYIGLEGYDARNAHFEGW